MYSKNNVIILVISTLSGILPQFINEFRSNTKKLDSTKEYSYCKSPPPNPSYYKPLKNGKLVSVHLIVRHGDRTPTSLLPLGYEKDPWYCDPVTSQLKNNGENLIQGLISYNQDLCIPGGYCARNPMRTNLWPGNCSSGQLTPKGISDLYNLGKVLKDIYINKLQFMSNSWNESERQIFARSSDFQRSQHSALTAINGLFYSSISPISNLNVYSFPLNTDTVFSNYRNCPKIEKLELEIKTSSIFKKYLDEVEPLKTEFEFILEGTRVGDHKYTLSYYVDIFQTRACNNLPDICKLGDTLNKKCTTKSMIKKIMEFANKEYELNYRDHSEALPVTARLRVGEIILETKRNILGAIEQDSAHDTTIAPVLGAFQSYYVDWPGYIANLITESWYQPSLSSDILDHYKLRLIYNGEPVRTPWCPSGTCLVKNFLDHLDIKLGIVGGFENYGSFLIPNQAPPAWDMFKECWSDL